jgi:hypothetical protein
MNFQRGLLRVWIVASVFWMIVIIAPETLAYLNAPKPVTDPAILAQLNSSPRSSDGNRPADTRPPFDPSKPFVVVPDKDGGVDDRTIPPIDPLTIKWDAPGRSGWGLLAMAAGAPVGALVLWLILVWVLRGFRAEVD